MDELESGEYNGWGYNNSFDDPEQASQESNLKMRMRHMQEAQA